MLLIDYATTDAEAASRSLASLYDQPDIRDVGPGFRYEQHVRGNGEMTLERYHFGGDIETTADIPDALVSVQVHGGRFATREQGAVPNGSLHGLGPIANGTTDADFSTVTLPVPVLLRAGLQHEGAERGHLVVDGRAPRPELADYWAAVIDHAHTITADPTTFQNDLVRAETFRHLTAAAFAAFPVHVDADRVVPDTATAGAVVQRATRYMDDHVAEPIGAAEVATAARVSPRGLQAAFQRDLGITPMAYLRRARLAEAHRELLATDPTSGATVSAVALRWGFTNATRFGAAHRDAYGRSPQETLRDDSGRRGAR